MERLKPKQRVREIYGGVCANSNDPRFKHEGRPIIHHIQPKSEGGSSAKSNLILLCSECERYTHKIMEREERGYSPDLERLRKSIEENQFSEGRDWWYTQGALFAIECYNPHLSNSILEQIICSLIVWDNQKVLEEELVEDHEEVLLGLGLLGKKGREVPSVKEG